LTTEGCNGKFVFLLHLIQESNYSTVKHASFEGKLKAAGRTSRDEAVLVHSFEV
jgi:hypothetical protein